MQIPQLEVACEDCKGTGRNPGEYLCVVCDGIGFVLTDDGIRLRSFFRNHIQAATHD